MFKGILALIGGVTFIIAGFVVADKVRGIVIALGAAMLLIGFRDVWNVAKTAKEVGGDQR